MKKNTILVITACYDEPNRTMGSVPKISRQLSKYARVVVFSGGSSDRVEDRSKDLRVYFVKEWLIPDPINNGFIPEMFKKLKRLLEKEKPDVVLNVKYMFYPNLIAPYLHRRGYTVYTATDAFPGYSWFTRSKIANVMMWIYTRTLGKYVLKNNKEIILFHEALIKDAKKLRLKHTLIHNGVEFEIAKAAKPRKLKGKFKVFYVGRLESVKGYDIIVEAMQQLTTKHRDIHFYQIGDMKGKEKFVRQNENDNVHFLGRMPLKDVMGFLKSGDVVILGSITEGLPNAVIEGMACGCVTVSTPVGAVPWILERGKLGKLVPYGDVKALAKAVEWLYNHPMERKAMAKRGKEKIIREYNWETLGKRYYETLCPESSASHGKRKSSSRKR